MYTIITGNVIKLNETQANGVIGKKLKSVGNFFHTTELALKSNLYKAWQELKAPTVRLKRKEYYYSINKFGDIETMQETRTEIDDLCYSSKNYFSTLHDATNSVVYRTFLSNFKGKPNETKIEKVEKVEKIEPKIVKPVGIDLKSEVEPKVETKVCKNCKEIKPLSEFYNYSKSPDGKDPVCKECKKEKYGTPNRKTKKVEPKVVEPVIVKPVGIDLKSEVEPKVEKVEIVESKGIDDIIEPKVEPKVEKVEPKVEPKVEKVIEKILTKEEVSIVNMAILNTISEYKKLAQSAITYEEIEKAVMVVSNLTKTYDKIVNHYGDKEVK